LFPFQHMKNDELVFLDPADVDELTQIGRTDFIEDSVKTLHTRLPWFWLRRKQFSQQVNR
jgi:hypothetical protein